MDLAEDGRMADIARFTHQEDWAGGTAMWAPLNGTWHSSTRAELAALVMAMQIKAPIHIGIDNKTVVDKANKLIEIARQIEVGIRDERK